MSHLSNSEVLTYFAAIIRTIFHLQSASMKALLEPERFGGSSGCQVNGNMVFFRQKLMNIKKKNFKRIFLKRCYERQNKSGSSVTFQNTYLPNADRKPKNQTDALALFLTD